MPPPFGGNPPYLIYGTLKTDTNINLTNEKIAITNLMTKETQVLLTNEKGEHLFDCLNFSKGYSNKDNIECSYSGKSNVVIIDTKKFRDRKSESSLVTSTHTFGKGIVYRIS